MNRQELIDENPYPGMSSIAEIVVFLINSFKVDRFPNSFSTVVCDLRMEPVQIDATTALTYFWIMVR